MKNIHSGGFWIKMQDFWHFVHCCSSLTTRNHLHFNGNVSLIFWLPAALYWLKWRGEILWEFHITLDSFASPLRPLRSISMGRNKERKKDQTALIHLCIRIFLFLSKGGLIHLENYDLSSYLFHRREIWQ